MTRMLASMDDPKPRRRSWLLGIAFVAAVLAGTSHVRTWLRSGPGAASTGAVPQRGVSAYGVGAILVAVGTDGSLEFLFPSIDTSAFTLLCVTVSDPNAKMYVLRGPALPPSQRAAIVFDGHRVTVAALLPGGVAPLASVHAGALWALAIGCVGLRQGLRWRDVRQSGRVCKACGYARTGLMQDAACPECGAIP